MADEAPTAADPTSTTGADGAPTSSADSQQKTPADSSGSNPAAKPPTTTEPTAEQKAAAIEATAKADAEKQKAERAAAVERAQLIDKYGADVKKLVDESTDENELRASLKKLLGKRYSAKLVLAMTEDVDTEENLSVDERIERRLQAERERVAAESKKKDDELLALQQQQAQKMVDDYVKETSEFINANLATYPFIELFGLNGDDVAARMQKKYEETGRIWTPQEIVEEVEGEHRERSRGKRLGDRLLGATKPIDEDLDDSPRLRPVQKRDGSKPYKSLEEEIDQELAEFDENERAKLRRRA